MSPSEPRVSVVLCTRNEEGNLPHVLPRIPSWVDEVVLVDAHSTDNTVSVARQLRPDIKVLYQREKGKAEALNLGIAAARNEIVVCLDADGDSPPEDIGRFVEPMLDGYDMAKGSRLAERRPAKMSPYNWVGNRVLALACNVLFQTHFTDVCAGYYALKKQKFLELGLSYSVREAGCSMEQEMVVKALKAGMKVKEIPYTSGGRIRGTSAIQGIGKTTRQGFTDLFVIVRERFRG